MEKPTPSSSKTKSNFLKFLPKTSSIYFQNPPFSPNRVKPAAGKGFSGSIIPDEARRRSKSGSTNSFYTQEPTSPKISCMGQIKHKKKSTNKSNNPNPDPDPKRDPGPPPPLTPQVKRPSAIKRFLTGNSKPDMGRRRSDASIYDKQPLSAGRAPALSQMKRFASGRETLAGFDWSSEFSPAGGDRRGDYSDEEFEGEEEEIVIPFPAAVMGGSAAELRPRKEVNLWKRRTVDPPKSLQLNKRGDAFVAEAMSCKEALSWIKDQNYVKVILEIDALNVINALNNELDYLTPSGSILADCKAFMSYIPNLTIVFARKSVNQTAHLLAKSVDSSTCMEI